MKTWLFAWNPKRYTWEGNVDGYKELMAVISQVGCAYIPWTCGVNKSILPGDRIFLIKLGVKERGIVASGYAATSVFEGTHWDESLAAEGKKTKRVYIKMDKICNPDSPAIQYDYLCKIAPDFKWSIQGSGITIPDKTANELELIWSKI